jgi:hypothetical protein
VDILNLEPEAREVVGEVFGHALGKREYQAPLAALGSCLHFLPDVFHLSLAWAHLDLWVHEPGRANHLLDDARGAVDLFLPWGSRHEDRLVEHPLELGDLERAVIERARKPEAEVDEVLLAGPVPLVHRADLRHGNVAFVHEEEKVLGEIVKERGGGLADGASRDRRRIVLYAGAVAHLGEHLDVVLRPRLEPLGLKDLSLNAEALKLLVELLANALKGLRDRVLPHDEVLGGVYR